ncbi:hypothetical protein, partial [Burkholderia ubonensis]|uniref:hypothetical protein n=1 Tax=Burkholderia ubonensis TaxID=101571 RepID=UPI001E2E71B1
MSKPLRAGKKTFPATHGACRPIPDLAANYAGTLDNSRDFFATISFAARRRHPVTGSGPRSDPAKHVNLSVLPASGRLPTPITPAYHDDSAR